MWQQLPLAVALFAVGVGPGCLGIAVRVTVCVTGHWLIGHFAHREGRRSFLVRGAGCRASTCDRGLLSMGESWHTIITPIRARHASGCCRISRIRVGANLGAAADRVGVEYPHTGDYAGAAGVGAESNPRDRGVRSLRRIRLAF